MYYNNTLLSNTGPPSPPANILCGNTSNGIEITWSPVTIDSCAMSTVHYNVSIRLNFNDLLYSMAITSENRVVAGNQLMSNSTLFIVVNTIIFSCGASEPATFICVISTSSLPPPPLTTSEYYEYTHTSPKG